MKLYDGGRAPNPRRVKVFLAEKGITVPIEQVDLGKLAHKSPDYTAVNPVAAGAGAGARRRHGHYRSRSRSAAISSSSIPSRRCSARAPRRWRVVEMWERRIEFHLLGAGLARVPQLASRHEGDGGAAGAGLGRGQQAARDGLSRAARPRAEGPAATSPATATRVADITGMIAVDFMKPAKLAVPDDADQPQALARRGVGAAEREGLRCG